MTDPAPRTAAADDIRRWDVFWAYLDPVAGGEDAGRQQVLVISNDAFNSSFPVVTVLPLTKLERKRRRVYPFEVEIPSGSAGIAHDSIAMPYQVRTISKTCLRRRIGSFVDEERRSELEERLVEHLGVELSDAI